TTLFRSETDLDVKVFGLIPDPRLLETQWVRVRGSPGFLSLTEMALYNLLPNVKESATTEELPDLLQRVPEVAVEIVVVVPLLGGQARPDSLERLSPSTLVKLPKRQHIRSLTPHELKSDLVCEVVCFGYVRPLGGHPLSRRLNLRIQLRDCFVTF